MTKAFLNFFFALCILLLSGQGQLSAQTHPESSDRISSESHESAGAAESGVQSEHAVFKSLPATSHPDNSLNFTFLEIEEEEDERFSSKKHLAGRAMLTAILFALLLGYFFQCIKNRLAYYEHLFCCSPSVPLFIAFRVFRI